MMIKTELIVLRKIPYRETSVIFSGISPEYGRLDFLLRGGFKVSKTKFPVIDLFRKLSIEYRDRQQDLLTLYTAELSDNYDTISNYPENFMKICELSGFLLKYSKHNINCAATYSTLDHALKEYSESSESLPWTSLVKLVFLQENGFLPEHITVNDPKLKSKMDNTFLFRLVDAAIGSGPLPELNEDEWHILSTWISSLCLHNDLN